jgi:gas vesicle protein
MIEQNKYDQALAQRYNSGIGVRDALTFLLIGGGIGATLALLFAPKSGSELRGEIADVTRKGYDATLEKASELKAQSTEAIHLVKEKAEAAYDFALTKLNTRSDALSKAVSDTSEALTDGLDEIRNETGGGSKQSGVGRKSASIF